MKNLTLLLLLASLGAAAADDASLKLIRRNKAEAVYFENNTIRRTGQYVMVWTVTFKGETKSIEALTEFDCQKLLYRQLSLRSFLDNQTVISGDAVYKQWFDAPDPSQYLGLLFRRLCVPSDSR